MNCLWPPKIFARLGLILIMATVAATSHAAEKNSHDLSEQGQRAFDNGSFSEAAVDWQKAAEHFRKDRNTNAEIRTLVSEAGAYEALGQYRPAVHILEGALV